MKYVGFEDALRHMKTGGSVHYSGTTYMLQNDPYLMFYITDSNSTGFISSIKVIDMLSEEWALNDPKNY